MEISPVKNNIEKKLFNIIEINTFSKILKIEKFLNFRL